MRLPATAAAAILASSLAVVPALAETTIEQAIAIAKENGMSEVHEVDLDRGDGKWELEGVDADGRGLEIDIDVASGEIVKTEVD